ncbi:MAG: VanZ family protein, partial [Propionibacteriaceae bacterium]
MSAVTRPFRWLLIPLAAAYLVGVLWITLLPLPADPRSWCAAHPEVGLALYPLAFVEYIARALGAGQPWHRTALEVAANIALFVPLGMFVRLITRRGVASAALIGFGVSIFIEASQLSGLWGTIPCAYRYADVNDVLNNTTGAILGACLVWRRGETLVARRWTGMVLDAAMV